MPTIHRADEPTREPWTRQHKLTITGIALGLTAAAVATMMAILNYTKPSPASPPAPTSPITIINYGRTVADGPQNPIPSPDPQQAALCGDSPGDRTGGWGPMRQWYSGAQPAPVPTLNSVTDSPWGDERRFFAIRDADAPPTSDWQINLKLERNHSYELRILVSNSAAAPIPDSSLKRTRVSVNLPTCTGQFISTVAFVDAKNANPTEVYNSVGLSADQPFNISYESTSARQCTNTNPCSTTDDNLIAGGLQLPEDIFTSTGAAVGTNALDGIVGGGNGNAVMVMFRIHPQFAA